MDTRRRFHPEHLHGAAQGCVCTPIGFSVAWRKLQDGEWFARWMFRTIGPSGPKLVVSSAIGRSRQVSLHDSMKTITSRDNSLLRQARAVRDGKDEDLIFVEGLRLSEEALRSGLTIASVIVSEELARKDKAAKLIEQLEASSETLRRCQREAARIDLLHENSSGHCGPRGAP